MSSARLRILDARDVNAVDELLGRRRLRDAGVERRVLRIVDDVRRRGDQAVLDYARRLDGLAEPIEVTPARRALEKLPGVSAIHHLHIWSISTTETALTVHLVVADDVDRDKLIRQANAYTHEMFGISHSTIQVESADMNHDHDCHPHGHRH